MLNERERESAQNYRQFQWEKNSFIFSEYIWVISFEPSSNAATKRLSQMVWSVWKRICENVYGNGKRFPFFLFCCCCWILRAHWTTQFRIEWFAVGVWCECSLLRNLKLMKRKIGKSNSIFFFFFFPFFIFHFISLLSVSRSQVRICNDRKIAFVHSQEILELNYSKREPRITMYELRSVTKH